MQELRALGTLLPSSLDFLPSVKLLRDKCGVHGVGRDAELVEELSLHEERVSLENFRREIRALVQGAPDLLPPARGREAGTFQTRAPPRGVATRGLRGPRVIRRLFGDRLRD